MVYASEAQPLPPTLAGMLQRAAVVLLHSAEAGHHFAALADEHHLARASLSLATLGERVARAAGGGWANVAVAATPSDAALLALAREMCQDAPARQGR